MDLDYTDDLDECTEPEDSEELPASLLNDHTVIDPTRGSHRLGRTSTTPTANHS